jgi:hypothetical protein
VYNRKEVLKIRGGIVLNDSNDSFNEMDEYSDAVNKMDSLVVIISTLELMSGILGGILTIMHFSDAFYPAPVAFIIATVSYGAILGALAIISLIVGWGLWRLEPWAWGVALAISIASLVAYLPSLSPVMIPLNAILVWLLRKPEIQNAYTEIEPS